MSLILHREQDLEAIRKKMNDIVYEAKEKEVAILDPTLKEFNTVMQAVKDFIKRNKKIVYGGSAINALIAHKNIDAAFYTELDMADIEFYSSEPYKDIMNLTKELHKAGFKHVRCRQAQHEDTYTIHINFHGYCDVSYMPAHLYNHAPTITLDGIRYIHPDFNLIDRYRVFTDPLNSFRILEKTLCRHSKLIKYYPPREFKGDLRKIPLEGDHNKFLEYTRKEILPNVSSLIVVGYYAYHYYMYKAKDDQKLDLYVPYYEAISTNYKEDVKSIYNMLEKYYGTLSLSEEFKKRVTTEEYYPFFQFFGKKVVYLLDGKPFLIIYDNYEKCHPYTKLEKKKINIATFPITIVMLLMNKLYHRINKNKKEMGNMWYMFSSLIKYRNKYFKKHNKTVMDNTPFKEFQVECMGYTINPRRKFFLGVVQRKKEGKRAVFEYDPSRDNTKLDNWILSDRSKFGNFSGNIINNPKNRVLNGVKE